ncbi:MAG: TrkH family potassium uptake protein [Nitrososphaerales archaeon]
MVSNIRIALANVVKAIGLTLIIPAIVALIYSESFEFTIFSICAFIVSLLGLLMCPKASIGEITLVDAFIISASSWLLASLIGAIPYISIAKMDPLDAYFESMSGFTTTGMTVIANIEALPRSLLLWRALTQWIGGIGIILFFILFVSPKGLGVWRLYIAEAREEKALTTTKGTVIAIWLLYSILTVICASALIFVGLEPFEAIAHALTAISTGGFSTRNMSIASFENIRVNIILMIFMIIGATNFIVLIRAMRFRSLRIIIESIELKFCLSIIMIASFIIALDLLFNWKSDNFFNAFHYAIFHVISILTTTGYTLSNIAEFPNLTAWVLTILMMIGGSLGSTAGGIKIMRIIIVIKALTHSISILALPERIIKPFKIKGHEMNLDDIFKITSFFTAYFILIFIEGMLITLSGNIHPFNALSAALSSQGNVGPSFLQISSNLPNSIKAVLIFGMWAGRLEVFPVITFIPYILKKILR